MNSSYDYDYINDTVYLFKGFLIDRVHEGEIKELSNKLYAWNDLCHLELA